MEGLQYLTELCDERVVANELKSLLPYKMMLEMMRDQRSKQFRAGRIFA